ncbi:hypothetical protein ColTof4_02852 [Colletotrichum tofieldiae]|uniref:Uncharacterized protein n=1 Tax=Colletotrichum tofieldiae TaxID=708197 RepID=A0A166SIC8_9PEZI|nr:hypothetical protein CT0861_07583 [Colletotrichum tofieldiae]GKT61510.1 hypothetical protein ColTof3_08849 [Colletotrichum tofieldiae]GKT70429.1 hypothetical protein ColTof4_02852 [Colletotrichum tofieldiae]GKT93495.1 hypothetical protein Ct61P_11345 [Colletotrichum tofieldiae]
MQVFTTMLVLAAMAFAAPNVIERQNTGCFGAGQACLSTSDCCNYQTGKGGSCVWPNDLSSATGTCT